MNIIFAQQGDVILQIVSEIPEKAKKIKLQDTRFIIERGEGVHTHELVSDTLANDVEIYQEGDVIYLKTNKAVKLTHEEHGVQTLDPNKIYKKVVEREFDYEQMEARNTQD